MKRIFTGLIAVLSLACCLVSCKTKTDGDIGKNLINTVVLVNFGDGNFGDETETVGNAFAGGENSLDGYVSFVSEGKTTVKTTIAAEITADNPKEYYLPAYAETTDGYEPVNELGYDNRAYGADGEPAANGEKYSVEPFLRKEELISEVISKIGRNFKEETDGDNDGFVDCLTLVFNIAEVPPANSLLWASESKFFPAKMSELTSVYVVDGKYSDAEIKTQKLGDKSINDYIFIPLSMIETDGKAQSSAICHEFLHVLGAGDLYSYTDAGKEAVGELDIMAESYGGDYPAMPLSYTRYKLGFLNEGENIAPVSGSGEYTLFSTESGRGAVKAYKLCLPEYAARKESFYIEYREKIGYGAGLSNGFDGGAFIIYRVNEDNGYISRDGKTYGSEYLGNAYGENEVYVFRFSKSSGGKFTENESVSKNNISYAAVSDLEGYISFGADEKRKNFICYSDGTDSGVSVTFKRRNADGSATFEINLNREVKTSAEVDKPMIFKTRSGKIALLFDAPLTGGNAYVFESEKLIAGISAKDVISGKYGKANVVPLAFMRAFVSGEKNYIYVVTETADGNAELYTYALRAEENDIVKGALLTGGVVLGASAAVAVAVVVAVKISKSRGKTKKSSEKNQKN